MMKILQMPLQESQRLLAPCSLVDFTMVFRKCFWTWRYYGSQLMEFAADYLEIATMPFQAGPGWDGWEMCHSDLWITA
jgi:hypothetical protein